MVSCRISTRMHLKINLRIAEQICSSTFSLVPEGLPQCLFQKFFKHALKIFKYFLHSFPNEFNLLYGFLQQNFKKFLERIPSDLSLNCFDVLFSRSISKYYSKYLFKNCFKNSIKNSLIPFSI